MKGCSYRLKGCSWLMGERRRRLETIKTNCVPHSYSIGVLVTEDVGEIRD